MRDLQKSELNRTTRRRQLLKGLATGGGIAATMKTLPEGWTKPVVKYVLLPAHAQTSVIPPIVFTLTCQVASGPAGDPTAPGPDVDTNPPTIVDPQAVVTPAPGGTAMVFVEIFRNGALFNSLNQDISSGMSAGLGFSSGSTGQLEVRYTFSGMTCSLFWNCVDIP